jgi:hypothetical protein
MEYVRNMYERFAGDLEDELDDSLERAPHVSSFGYDEKLMDFARAIYPKTRRKYPKGFWQASDRAGLAIKVEEYEAFDGLRRDMGDAIDRWVRLSRDCGLWELLVATLREAPHEDVVKLLGYLEKARVDAMGHRTNLTRCGWWQLAEYWRSSSS